MKSMTFLQERYTKLYSCYSPFLSVGSLKSIYYRKCTGYIRHSEDDNNFLHLYITSHILFSPGNLEATVSLIFGAQQARSASMSLSSLGWGAFWGATREGPGMALVSSPSRQLVLPFTPFVGSGLGGSSRISVIGSWVQRSFHPFSNL